MAFEDAFDGADLGEGMGRLGARELHVDRVDVRWLGSNEGKKDIHSELPISTEACCKH